MLINKSNQIIVRGTYIKKILLIFDVPQACAPLYHWRTLKSTPEKDPVGTCYVAIQNFSAYAEYSPCRNSKLFLFLETEI